MFFRTLLASVLMPGAAFAQPDVTSIAFGSCLRDRPEVPIFDRIVDARPDVFLWLGDNIYGDSPDQAVLRQKYDALNARPGYAKLKSQTRILATWDDHDYGKNDAGKEWEAKDIAKAEFLRAFDEPKDSPRWSRAGVYESYMLGTEGKRVQVILLDTRSFRDALVVDEAEKPRRRYKPTTDASATVLGADQWTWLAAELKKPADLRIIGSSIQVLSNQHKFEHWGNFPHARQRLFDLIRDAGAKSVVLLSGDRHFAEIARGDESLDGVWEVTSSALFGSGKGNLNEPNPYRVGEAIGENNFGLIRIDWASRSATLQLVGEDGKPLREEATSFANP